MLVVFVVIQCTGIYGTSKKLFYNFFSLTFFIKHKKYRYRVPPNGTYSATRTWFTLLDVFTKPYHTVGTCTSWNIWKTIPISKDIRLFMLTCRVSGWNFRRETFLHRWTRRPSRCCPRSPRSAPWSLSPPGGRRYHGSEAASLRI